ncbi:hypothetical protein ACFL1I_07615 [Candidatus Omnitrophota bacterium]
MHKWITDNFWLKLISLILAIVTWFYVSGEQAKRQSNYYPQQPATSRP